jgi:hypothetical protein
MKNRLFPFILLLSLCWFFPGSPLPVSAGDLTVDLDRSEGITLVGAIKRWDEDGNPLKPVNAKAAIHSPEVTARAVRQRGNCWVFKKLPPGRYDLVMLTKNRVRVEGFHYPPLTEFDPFLPPTGKAPSEAGDWIIKDIAKAAHYENKVTPLFLTGTDKQVRIFMQLVRDQPTSYDAEYGTPIATVRHEVWQYTYRYGGWSKDRRTKVLDRILLPKSELQRWTWVWEPRLGGIEVKKGLVKVSFEVPRRFDRGKARGWFAGK